MLQWYMVFAGVGWEWGEQAQGESSITSLWINPKQLRNLLFFRLSLLGSSIISGLVPET